MEKPFSVPHTPEGLVLLQERLSYLEQLTSTKLEVILEATGNYSKALAHNLMDAGYSVVILNPLETHEQKRRSVRKIKTDKIDTNRIAKVYYLEEHNSHHIIDPTIAELRALCRHYDKLNILYTETQLRLQSIWTWCFPPILMSLAN